MEQLQANKTVLSEDQYSICEKAILEWKQGHLFDFWPAAGTEDQSKINLANQLSFLNDKYQGGLQAYVKNAKTLLESSKSGSNPFDGYVPQVPHGERLSIDENLKEFEDAEAEGMKIVSETAFLIVAGGLGERLGYSGIKLSLPTTIITMECYLKLYCDHILALQAQSGGGVTIPLGIMTSGDTHDKTLDLLEKHKNFGMKEEQITIIKQEKVPALLDNEAHFATVEGNKYEIETKPHGHGDVHSLLYSSGLANKWFDAGKKYLCFLQDTNSLVFRGLIAALGVTKRNRFAINSLTVPRRPGEAVGALCRLVNEEKNTELTVNVEYNQLDPLLRATTNPKGDVADKDTGFSPYPGNINVLIFDLKTYCAVLKSTQGMVPEFVNPKYADEKKTVFKKPTRLECMMQDFPRLLPEIENDSDGLNMKVGFTQMDRCISFSAVKNNLKDAEQKKKETGIAESAASGEEEIFEFGRIMLKLAGVKNCAKDAKIVLKPGFGSTIHQIKDKFKSPGKVVIKESSSLVLDGNVEIHELTLKGHLEVSGNVMLKSLKVENEGIKYDSISEDAKVDEVYAIRGYVLKGSTKERVIENKESEKKVINESESSSAKEPKEEQAEQPQENKNDTEKACCGCF